MGASHVAVYGGSFDPPHVAHLLTASYVLAVGGFDRLLVVPVYEHAFDKPLAPFEARVAMCRLCFEDLPRVEVSDVEVALPRPSYTERTLERIQGDHPDWSLRFVIGSDALADTEKWHDYGRVVALAPPFVVTRSGHEGPELGPVLLPDVSSTRIRELVRDLRSEPARRELESIVPRTVLQFIDVNGLYR